jgi:hypothetical protein
MPGICGPAGSASCSATPWPCTCVNNTALAPCGSPTSSAKPAHRVSYQPRLKHHPATPRPSSLCSGRGDAWPASLVLAALHFPRHHEHQPGCVLEGIDIGWPVSGSARAVEESWTPPAVTAMKPRLIGRALRRRPAAAAFETGATTASTRCQATKGRSYNLVMRLRHGSKPAMEQPPAHERGLQPIRVDNVRRRSARRPAPQTADRATCQH